MLNEMNGLVFGVRENAAIPSVFQTFIRVFKGHTIAGVHPLYRNVVHGKS